MNTSITTIGTSDFSSDLERGAAPRSIADDKSEVPIVVLEIQRCEVRKFFDHRYTYWELHPLAPARCEAVILLISSRGRLRPETNGSSGVMEDGREDPRVARPE